MRTTKWLVIRILCLALSAGFVACEDKKDAGEAKPSKGAAETLIGAKPELPGEVSQVTWGGKREEVIAALGWEDDGIDSKTHEGVRFNLQDTDGAVDGVRVVLEDPDGAVAKAMEAWGEGAEIEDLGEKKKRYFNPEKELLATVHITKDYDDKPVVEVVFQRYVDTKKVLGLTDKVALPPALSKLEFGMTKEEAEKAAGMDDSINDDPANPDVSYNYYVPEKDNTLENIEIKVENQDFKAMLIEAWGEPKKGKDISDNEILIWTHPEDGLRAVWSKNTAGFVYEEVEFTKYVPLATLIGKEKGKFGLEAPLLGATWEEIQAAYKDYINDKYVYYLPTDYDDSTFTSISFSYDDTTGKSTRVNLSVGFKRFPEVKDELLGVIKAVYGDPAEGKDYLNRDALIFHEKDPRVTVRFNDISTAWDITFSTED